MLKLKLTKHKNIDEAKTFEQHDPTHPEYPDFVKDFCYRLKSVSRAKWLNDLTSYIAVSFVYPNNVKNEELGFNFNLVTSAGMKGGSHLCFLTKTDAENFAKKYVSEAVTPYISGHSLELVRLDSHSDIPCYVESSFPPKINSISGPHRPPRMSLNLFARMSKNPITYQKNPFSSQDAGLNVKSTKALENIDKIIPQIEKNLESLKKICSNVDLLIDYKKADISVINATIAIGDTDKKFKDLLNSAWHYGKGDVLSIEIRTNKTESYFHITNSPPIFTFNLDLLPNNIKDMFSEKLFIEILANTLAKIYKYNQRFGYGEHQHQIVNPSSYWQTFAIQENSIEFDFRGFEFHYYQFENIEDLINVLNEAADNIKKAINIAADFLPKAIFTVDDFDEEEEE
jgi:hypothetical protein